MTSMHPKQSQALALLVSGALHLAVAGALLSAHVQSPSTAGQNKTVTMMVLAQGSPVTPQLAQPQSELTQPVRPTTHPTPALKPHTSVPPKTAQQVQPAPEKETQTISEPIAEPSPQADTQLPGADDPHWHQPLYKAAPDYPQKAITRGIEGDCSVRFDVNAEGIVGEPQAMEDCHPLFVRASLQAARAFRYQPLPADLASHTRQVVNTFHYRIE